MSVFMGWVIGISIVFGYGFMGGVTGRILLDNARRGCPQWPATRDWKNGKGPKPGYSFERCDADDHVECIFAGVFWPVSIPFVVGIKVASLFSDERRLSREEEQEKEHARKLELLEAETKRNESAKRIVDEFQPR